MIIVRAVRGTEARFGAVVEEEVRWFSSLMTSTELFGLDEGGLEGVLTRSTESAAYDGLELLAPVPEPSKIVCIGLNYQDHAVESAVEAPAEPLIFAKFPSSIVGPGEAVSWPAGLTKQVDWEGELAVVVGRHLSGASEQDCMAGIFGYTIGNDISARDLQFGDGQWVRGKSLDTFCPVGPRIITAGQFGNPQTKRVRTMVNGAVMQDGPTSDMIFSVGEILSYVCRQISLLPGDLVLTGTPPGVGAFRNPPVFLQSGDIVEVEIEDIGTLRTPVAGSR